MEYLSSLIMVGFFALPPYTMDSAVCDTSLEPIPCTVYYDGMRVKKDWWIKGDFRYDVDPSVYPEAMPVPIPAPTRPEPSNDYWRTPPSAPPVMPEHPRIVESYP